jgi:multiple sugar transport system permease protein
MDLTSTRARWWQWLVAVVVLGYLLAPFAWMLVVSITPQEELFTSGVRYFPLHPTPINYVKVFEYVAFTRAFLSSTLVATVTTALAISVATFAGYGFARFRFAGQNLIISSLLLIYMLPSVVLLVPMLVLFRTLGILNSYPALILAELTHAIPFAVWLMTNYFRTLPRDLEEAAQVDGCTEVGALFRIALPLAVPGVIAAALFVLIASWNEFLFAFMFTSGDQVRTLPVLLRTFIMGDAGLFWGLAMAVAVMATLPVALAFLFFQRFLVGGLAAGAVKG